MDEQELYRLLGFVGTNVDEALTIDWIKTQLVDYAEAGDDMCFYKLCQIARHSKQKDEARYAGLQVIHLMCKRGWITKEDMEKRLKDF